VHFASIELELKRIFPLGQEMQADDPAADVYFPPGQEVQNDELAEEE
jgi:hypothetical protein